MTTFYYSEKCSPLNTKSLCAFLAQVDMYAGALFIQLALNWNIYIAIVLLLSVTAIYTIAGDFLYPLRNRSLTKECGLLLSVCLMCPRWSGSSHLHGRCANCYHAGRIAHPHGLQWVRCDCIWHPHTTATLSDTVVYLLRLCRGRRMERYDGGIYQRHTVDPRAKHNLRDPSRWLLPHIQTPSDLWPALAWRPLWHVHPLLVVLVFWSGTVMESLSLTE